MDITKIPQYELLEHHYVRELESEGYLMRHKKTGARVFILENDDNNKVFNIAFRTVPTDSTGVAHIIEHTVLCGSDRYPVKDPFVELAKGSLNTFLNAMTYSDKTMYPLASTNDKDFFNLMSVYMDGVFHPNITKERKIFEQEGWHYEMDSPDGELTYNGVVYNEMKGAFSSPDDVVEREIMNSLYPDITYGLESGGDPDVIPELTYEDFLSFHKKFYHPSNSYIYLYGNLDALEYLEYLDKEYLGSFDSLQVDSEVGKQEAFKAPQNIRKQYSVMEEETAEGNYYLTYNVSMGSSLDRELYAAMDILDYVLCSAPGAAVKQALIDKGIGKDVYTTLENGIGQPYFSIIAKNADEDQLKEFVETIEETLKEQVRKGLNKKALLAAINYFEFKYREADYGSYPRGLILGLQALDSWLYDETKPFLHIEANETYGKLKASIDQGYFEGLIKTYLLENHHKTILVVEPVPGLTTRKDQALAEKLKAYKASLTREQIEQIVEKTHGLLAYQEEEDSPEALATIPLLKREDMKKEAAPYVNEVKKAGKITLLYHNVFTNGIGYLNLVFDLKKVPERLLPYVGILKSALTMVSTKNFGYGELFNEINIHTGGIQTVVNTYTNAENMKEYKATLEIRAKVLYEKRDKALELMKEILLTSDFEDTKRFYEIICEAKSRMQASMTGAGHSTALIRTLAYFSPTAVFSEKISGIPQYRLLEELEKNFDEKKQQLTADLKELIRYIFRPENLLVDYTAAPEGLKGLSEEIEKFVPDLITSELREEGFTLKAEKKNEGFMTAGQVQYVCRAGNFSDKGLPYTGALKVLKVMMGYDYLWNQVRVKGGAYGCMCGFYKNGDGYFVSYRDPNLQKTIEVYENAAQYIKNAKLDERMVTQFIIGAISELDTPMTPAAKGLYSMGGYLTGLSMERVQKEREELLATTRETLCGLYKYVQAFMDGENLCVIGNGEKIKENKELFYKVEQLFH